MAIIQPGPLASDIRGSMGGTVFSRNRSGMYIRRRVAPINPQTARQMTARNNVAAVQAYFQSAAMDDYRAGWAALAAITTGKNKVGLGITLTAQNLFLRVNTLHLLCDEDIVEEAPTIPDACACPILVITGDTTDGIVATAPDPVLADGDVLYFLLSTSLNQTINFFKGPYAHAVPSKVGTVFPLTLLANTTIVIGQRYFWRARFSNALGQVAPVRTGVIDIAA